MTPEIREALEPEQTSAQRDEPYPRRQWGRGVQALLWVLRVYVILAVPLVIYAFFHGATAQ
jgi:hypothetical protein